MTLSGDPQVDGVAYLMLDFPDTDTDPVTGACTEGTVLLTAALPETADSLTVNIFGGAEEYGQYESLLLDFVRIEKQNGVWCFVPSPFWRKMSGCLLCRRTRRIFFRATSESNRTTRRSAKRH